MTYQVLARKWRPQRFEEVMGQEPIIRSLKNALSKNQIGHAYLFSGTRGVGKTTVARLFSKALTCLARTPEGNPCLTCLSCKEQENDVSMDVIEIDGASHNGVDHIRTLIENVHYLPVHGAYKVYIIDEVHMLSKEAFNALLKTLEAPPAFVVFIFATTLPEKLLDTVLSRCQRFDFKEGTEELLTQHILSVAAKENLTFSSPHLAQILAKEASGSLRDALSLLDQVSLYSLDNTITEETLQQSLGLVRKEHVRQLLTYLYKGEVLPLSKLYRDILRQEVGLKRLILAILDDCFELIQKDLLKQGTGKSELFWIYETLLKDFQWAQNSLSPHNAVEIVLQKVALRRDFFFSATNPPPSRKEAPKESGHQEQVEKSVPQEESSPKEWQEFIDFVYLQHPNLALALEHASPQTPLVVTQGVTKLHVAFAEKERAYYQDLIPPGISKRLSELLASFMEIPVDKVVLKMTLIEEEKAIDLGLQSHKEKKEKEFQDLIHSQQEKLRHAPLVEKAMSLFGGQNVEVRLYSTNDQSEDSSYEEYGTVDQAGPTNAGKDHSSKK